MRSPTPSRPWRPATDATGASGLVAILLIGAARRDIHTPTFDIVRGGAVVYLVTTGIVFSVLLSGTDVDTAIPWVNSVLHEVMPLVIVIDWLLDPPSRHITYRQSLLWLAYPLAWVAYTLIRGPIADWYPYPFLDPASGGYRQGRPVLRGHRRGGLDHLRGGHVDRQRRAP